MSIACRSLTPYLYHHLAFVQPPHSHISESYCTCSENRTFEVQEYRIAEGQNKLGSIMTATNHDSNHDDQLHKIYRMTSSDLNCTFGVSFSRFHC